MIIMQLTFYSIAITSIFIWFWIRTKRAYMELYHDWQKGWENGSKLWDENSNLHQQVKELQHKLEVKEALKSVLEDHKELLEKLAKND